MDFFKYFHFGLKRKYKYLLFGVVVAMLVFNLLSLFGYCESVELTKDNSKYINDDGDTSTIISNETTTRGICYYYCSSPGTLTIESVLQSRRYYFVSGSIETGLTISRVGVLAGGETAVFQVNEPCYFLMNYTNNTIPVNLDFVSSKSMSNTMVKLVTSVSADNMWSVFNNSISFVAVSVLVGIGFWFVIRLIDLVSKKGNR